MGIICHCVLTIYFGTTLCGVESPIKKVLRASNTGAKFRPDMGNPTVGLVYYTATLHYNCSFKSSLPNIATLL